jgi:fumarate hydratase subunit alpha
LDQTKIITGIVKLIRKAETELPDDVIKALKKAYLIEEGLAKTQIATILDNIKVSRESQRPMCQDTGIQSFYVSLGVNSPYRAELKQLITSGVKVATKEIPLRPNTVDPLTGVNHQDNTGQYIPHITWDLVSGDKVWVTAFPKGGGSENMSRLEMLKPGEGLNGVKNFIVNAVTNAGGQPCPPTIVGVGIGGGADLAVKLAKKALLRPIGSQHSNPSVAIIEEELISQLNASGIGPMGLGGKTTVLDVNLEVAHRHPASLPVGLVIQCWANRRASLLLHADGTYEVQ